MERKHIYIAYTGGTIGMQKSVDHGYVPVAGFMDKQLAGMPEFHRPEMPEYTIHEYEPLMDSSDMTPLDWQTIADDIRANYDKYDGFVILHGTDTMAYTASALSFLLEDLCKPVILTGSQLPIGVLRTDAKENLISSIEIAASGNTPEVCLYFEYKLLRGNRTVKVNAEHFEAFDSPNLPPLAEAGVRIKYLHKASCDLNKSLISHSSMSEDVALLKLYPGIQPKLVKAVLDSNCKGIVLETFGSGNATTQEWFINSLQEVIKKGVVVLNISQCLAGNVSQGFYETSSELEKIGVVSGGDMTTEAALTKLMFLLGQNLSVKKIKSQLSISLRGELS